MKGMVLLSKQKNYLAIAITTKCNLSCFYCRRSGECVYSENQETLDFASLVKIINVAYDLGISTFRITGGEPTMVEYLPKLIEYIMKIGDDIQIRLNTNGYNIKSVMDVIQTYKSRIDVLISVDSISGYLNGNYFPKHLSKEIEILAKELVGRAIRTRFNIVVTKSNYNEIPSLIDKALSLGVNIKLLDLNIRDEYLGSSKLLKGEEAIKYGKSLYQPLDPIKEYLEGISTNYKDIFNISNSNGISMTGYFVGNQSIQVKDSANGAMYAKICKQCPHFESCQDGVFSLFLDAGEVLHISGCANDKVKYDLKHLSNDEIKFAFKNLLKHFEGLELIKK